jgi:beta-galactosidase
MQPITFDKLCYRINGEPTYLYSGEFHYFRVPQPDWRRRMRLFKEAGGNCLATYIPWLIHEPEEGHIVFGDTPYRDFEGFVQAAQDEGLYIIARPGPYQYSELRYDGLPGWLCENYPQLLAHNLDGKPFRTSSISYLHPLFLEKVQRWFSHVCPLIARHTVAQGGPIAFTQLDNEMTGIHIWFGTLDYNAESMGIGQPDGRYTRFLQTRFEGDLAALNRAYATSYIAFADVRPCAPPASGALPEVRRAKDYFDYYLGTIAEYAQTLASMMREHSIATPFVHNSGNPGMNAHFLETAQTLGSDFLLGSDHYYTLDQNWAQNNPTPQYAVNVFCSNEMLRLMGYPPTVYELPGGSLADWPPVTPHDARACYLSNLALGMKGSNFYIYTGGPNVPGTGVTADIYDYGASVGPFGEIRPLYEVQKDFGRWVAARPWLVEASAEYDFRIALDFEHVRADNYWKARGEVSFGNGEAYNFLRRGVLMTAFCASLSPALVNLDVDDWTSDTRTPVLIVSAASMARAGQQRIINFLSRGGRVLLTPVMPTFDEHLQPCTLLADFLGFAQGGSHSHATQEINARQFVRVNVLDVTNIWSNGDVYFAHGLPPGAEVIGLDEYSGHPLAWQQATTGGGQFIGLGLRWYQAKREHEQMLKELLQRLDLQATLECSNPNVWATLRTSGGHSALFLLNLLSSPMQATVTCHPAWRNSPYSSGPIDLPPMTVQTIEIE